MMFIYTIAEAATVIHWESPRRNLRIHEMHEGRRESTIVRDSEHPNPAGCRKGNLNARHYCTFTTAEVEEK